MCVKTIPFSKREAWFILGDIIQAHKFPMDGKKLFNKVSKYRVHGRYSIYSG